MNNFDRVRMFLPKSICEIDENLFEDRKGSLISIPSEYLKELLGINFIGYNSEYQNIVIDITGKINASKNNFGYINKTTIFNAFEKVKETGFVTFNNDEALETAIVGLCHITKDIVVDDIEKTLFELKKHIKNNCDRQNIVSYDYGGIKIFPIAKTRKDNLTIYPKYNELTLEKNRIYKNIVGNNFVDSSPNLLRFELQLEGSYGLIRRFFNMNKEQNVYLKDLLNSSVNPLIKKLEELRLQEVS